MRLVLIPCEGLHGRAPAGVCRERESQRARPARSRVPVADAGGNGHWCTARTAKRRGKTLPSKTNTKVSVSLYRMFVVYECVDRPLTRVTRERSGVSCCIRGVSRPSLLSPPCARAWHWGAWSGVAAGYTRALHPRRIDMADPPPPGQQHQQQQSAQRQAQQAAPLAHASQHATTSSDNTPSGPLRGGLLAGDVHIQQCPR